MEANDAFAFFHILIISDLNPSGQKRKTKLLSGQDDQYPITFEGDIKVRRMSGIRHLIEQLRKRSDVGVVDEAQSWRICITKGRDLVCEVTVPHDVLEWFASVRQRHDQKEVWSDWMDYSGYDDRPREQLEVEMAGDILAFIDRVSTAEQLLPLKIHETYA